MPGPYTIHLDPSIPPVQHTHREVLIEAREQIEKNFQNMVDQGIITPVTRSPQLEQTYHLGTLQGTTLDEISHRLSDATFFSKLEVKDEFWNIHLDTQSPYLTKFNTHKGCYWYLHMPFGLKMSWDVFQMCMDQITNRLSGIIAIHDDICVYWKQEKNMTNTYYMS